MRLELNVININDVQFGELTEIKESALCINRSELRDLLLEDERLNKVEIEIAHPGESCRILQVADVVEPRAKIEGPCEDFPGAIGKIGRVDRHRAAGRPVGGLALIGSGHRASSRRGFTGPWGAWQPLCPVCRARLVKMTFAFPLSQAGVHLIARCSSLLKQAHNLR